MKFSIIVAINDQNLVGIKEYGKFSLPWPNIQGDMKFFREITTSAPSNQTNAIIVGYNTWQTLPCFYKKNTKRTNIVICRNPEKEEVKNNEIYVESFEKALDFAEQMPNIHKLFVIGGSRIYSEALLHSSFEDIYVTHIHSKFPVNEVEFDYGIKFPLGHETFDELVKNETLQLSFLSDDIYDSGTNIDYCFKTFKISDRVMFNHVMSVISMRSTICFYQPPNQYEGDYQYRELIKKILIDGKLKLGRNGYTFSFFGYQLRYDLAEGYPISTDKRCFPKSIFIELMWMMRGQTDVRILQKLGVHIWDKNSSKEFLEKMGLPYREGDIGPGYGFQMRYFGAKYIDCETDYTGQGFDQLENCIKLINNVAIDPSGARRIIIDLWNSLDIEKMALPCCHYSYNFGVELYNEPINGKKGKLNCHLIQRSWDVLLGWNTATAALFTYLLANFCDLDPGVLIHSISDAHLYKVHMDSGAIDELLTRKPRKFPTLRILNKREKITDYEFSDLQLENYFPCPSIIAEMQA